MIYYRHAADPAPGVIVNLTTNGVLLDAQWYQVQWASDPQLFGVPFGRTESTYYETEFELGRYTQQFSPLPPERWATLRANRSLHFRIGAGDVADPSEASWDWTAPEEIRINHDPVANAGPSRQVAVDTNGSVAETVTLDAAGSSDEDPGSTLSYEWRLSEAAPLDPSAFGKPDFEAFVDATQQQLEATQGSTPEPFPLGATVPQTAYGRYTFELTVTDDDPASQKSGRRGTDSDTVTVTLNGPVTDLEILSPTAASPDRVYRIPESSEPGVEVQWQLSPALLSALTAAGGSYTLRASFRRHEPGGTGDVVYHEFALLRDRTTGSFTWPLTDVRAGGSVPAPRGQYDVVLEILDTFMMEVSLADHSTSAEELAAIDLDRPGLWADQYLVGIEVDENVFRGRYIVADFDVNSSTLEAAHTAALDQILWNGGDDLVVDAIVGRASQTGPEGNNLHLSLGRANGVAQHLISKGLDPARIQSVDGVGSMQPLQDEPGAELDINRSAEIQYRVAYYLPPKARVPPPSKPQDPKHSYRWAIRLQTSGGASYVLGVGFALGEIARLSKTAAIDPNDQQSIENAIEERRHGGFAAVGAGIGLSSPGANPWGDWSYFEFSDGNSQIQRTMDDFDGAFTQLKDLSGGFLVGYSISYISFPVLGVYLIPVGGLHLGKVGAEASITFGRWRFQ
jgi:outer membrane protein OmpA-like peptidoglycan-associated protein